MYILLYFLILGLVTYIINKTNNVDSSDEFLKWERQDLLIIGGGFLVALILQIIDLFMPIPILVMPIFALALVILIFYVNKNREKHIQEYKKQIEQIFEACSNLITAKEIDYNELPFKIVKDEKVKDQIAEIHLTMENPNKFNDGNCTNVTFTLNRYFPYYQWKYETDFPSQITKFIGEPIPPMMAKWPGSDFRPPEYIPIGLGGGGEVGLDLGAKDFGESSYVDEDGVTPGRISIPRAPQYLAVGSTGGGKAVWIKQEIW